MLFNMRQAVCVMLLSANTRSALLRKTVKSAVGLTLLFSAVLWHNDGFCQGTPEASTLTNLAEVRRNIAPDESPSFSARLEGVVLWVSPSRDRLILQDESAAILIRAGLSDTPSLAEGQRVHIEATCRLVHGELVFEPLIDNDGLHTVLEKSGSVYLSSGLHPISIQWFNGAGDFGLGMDCAGPELPRQSVPPSLLVRHESQAFDGASHILPGLDYRCYEGSSWDRLPDFSLLQSVKSGIVSNIDLSPRSRDTNVALVFSGYLRAPQSGIYTFWLKSDDGSRLFLNNAPFPLQILGPADWPNAQAISAGHVMADEHEYCWSEMEGVVTRINEVDDCAVMELTAATGRGYVKVKNSDRDYIQLLYHSRVKAHGSCRNISTVDGRIVAELFVPNWRNITVEELNPKSWTDFPVLSIASILKSDSAAVTGSLIHVSGTVSSSAAGSTDTVLLDDGTEQIPLHMRDAVTPAPGSRVEVLGWSSSEGRKISLRGCLFRELPKVVLIKNDTNTLPLLARAIQVKSLSRAEALRPYPVKIQGVVTARVGQDLIIQDPSWSVYCYCYNAPLSRNARIGDYWEFEGNSCIDFAPSVEVHRARYLRPGMLPEPLRPTWDELINGSLDTQYIEVQGVANLVASDRLTLLTPGGLILILSDDLQKMQRETLEGALIRIHGVVAPTRDTNHMVLATLRLFNASVEVDESAPQNPFETPLKRASDLLLFDPRANVLRRVKIGGVLLHARQGEFFVMDGTSGFRFLPKIPTKLDIGDRIEVVGFPDVSGPSPLLREAVARTIAKGGLPEPRKLSEDALLNGKLDSIRVRVDGRLVRMSIQQAEQVLELQAGTRSYLARLAVNSGTIPDIQPGSLLETRGVYSGLGSDRASGRDVDSFELLLNSPADIRVLARPSWWTIRHTLGVIAVMAMSILAGLIWIVALRRQVEQRTAELASEIKNRGVVERERALEEERSRIAQDLHDDLGATLTEIRFLSAVESRDSSVPAGTRSQLAEVSEKSREMVSALDEIVWAVNPANDSLPNLASYLRHVAEEFFGATGVHYRLDVDPSLPSVSLTSEMRHNIYLFVREAMNNIAKHSGATEAWLRIYWRDGVLRVLVEDNGRGFVKGDGFFRGNGLCNMRRRLEKIGASFSCNTQPGSGTVCRLELSLVEPKS